MTAPQWENYLTTDWMHAALCRGRTDVNFFPTQHESDTRARNICTACPVTDLCLEYAVSDPGLVGIWGGTSAKGREAIRRERGA